MSADKRGIRIVVKKKGGPHGGAWKVAYADFVTAMMAFFMVMWIMGMDAQQKDLIEGYFQNPVGFKKGIGTGQNPMSSGNAIQHMGARTIAIAAPRLPARAFPERGRSHPAARVTRHEVGQEEHMNYANGVHWIASEAALISSVRSAAWLANPTFRGWSG